MSSIIRKPSLSVKLNTVALSDVLSARVQAGFNMRVAEARVELRALPADIMPWDEIEITMGGTVGTAAVRFDGYFISAENQLYPKQTTLLCKGKLARAEWQINDTNIDMSGYPGNPGFPDETMVSDVLYVAKVSDGWTPGDIPDYMPTIGGTGQILGHYATDYGFEWAKGESGLSFIERLDAVCLGWRTYDTFDGTIKRTQITAIPGASAAFTFTEGIDIFRATESTTILDVKNEVIVSGFPGKDGDDDIEHTARGGNPFLIYFGDLSQMYHTQEFSSPMIEFEKITDKPSGYGLSCEEVALWMLDELNVYSERVMLTTPRDDVIEPGDTIAVVAPIRLDIDSRKFWVQQVDVGLIGGAFTQVLTCITGIPVSMEMESGDDIITEASEDIWSE
jgi:hypothetical protein